MYGSRVDLYWNPIQPSELGLVWLASAFPAHPMRSLHAVSLTPPAEPTTTLKLSSAKLPPKKQRTGAPAQASPAATAPQLTAGLEGAPGTAVVHLLSIVQDLLVQSGGLLEEVCLA